MKDIKYSNIIKYINLYVEYKVGLGFKFMSEKNRLYRFGKYLIKKRLNLNERNFNKFSESLYRLSNNTKLNIQQDVYGFCKYCKKIDKD